ncbi:tetraacyldisaccharide 4'-kinase [Candidatus Thioglobus autotrophicus]|uniref:Tetraacyldisaccharide 4'-kinase n=1 Tax=Candidatus Thioglobus autotrophicus TaxID=1705394 RepID=A0A0M4NVQ7_9GAMM|nr:tetraacyldisaccharide 4'-kinase [Candidatus Thioglobus autotrophicus]ALE52068.1 tetraacyldisaccharide 4'-kinase [Candidatus Thioglobus autotrophicus]
MDLNTRGVVNYLLWPVSGVFYALSKLRRALYRWGILQTHHFQVPVIVVGNITVGGSGKTPVVIKLVQYFKQQGRRVGVVSRGYGGTHTQGSLLVNAHTNVALSGDEPLLIVISTGVPVMVNKDRSQAVKDLIDQHQVDLVISDDGLQHYAMDRTVEIAVIDGNRRFGNQFFLPAGPLRESQNRLKQVDFIINNGGVFPGEVSVQLKPVKFVHMRSEEEFPLDFFKNQTCHGMAGIGHPERFFNTLAQLNIDVQKQAFEDHYPYQAQDLAFEDNYPIIMTAKDWVKCREFANDKMYYLKVDLDIGKDFLNKLAEKL